MAEDKRETDYNNHAVAQHDDILERWVSQRSHLLHLCLRYLNGNRADAEDAIGRATLVILERGWTISDVRAPEAWFKKIVYSACMDQHRERRQRKVFTFSEIDDQSSRIESAANHVDKGASIPDAEYAYLHHETIAYTRQVINELPHYLRLPLTLRIDHDLSYAEISNQLQVNEENLRKQVQTARQLVAPQIRRYLDGDPDVPRGLATNHETGTTTNQPACDLGFIDLHPTVVDLPSGERRLVFLPVEQRPPHWTQSREQHLVQYVEQHPGGWRKQFELADMLFFAGRVDEAFEQYRNLVSRGKAPAHVRLRFVEALGATGRNHEALEALDHLMNMPMSEAERAHLRGRLAFAGRDWRNAVIAFREAAKHMMTKPANGILLGWALLASGRPAMAMATLDEVRTFAPDDVVALWSSHDAATAMGYEQRARQFIKLAAHVDPESIPAMIRLTARCIADITTSKTARNAEKLVQHLRRLAPHLAETYACEALLSHVLGKSNQAEALLSIAIVSHQQNSRLHLALARLLFAMHREGEALRAIRTAMQIDPDDLEICEEALRMVTVIRPHDTLAIVEQILLRAPEHVPIMATAATALAARGGVEADAIAMARRAVELSPGWPIGWLMLGTLLRSLGQHEEGAENIETGLSLLPPEDKLGRAAWAQSLLDKLPRTVAARPQGNPGNRLAHPSKRIVSAPVLAS